MITRFTGLLHSRARLAYTALILSILVHGTPTAAMTGGNSGIENSGAADLDRIGGFASTHVLVKLQVGAAALPNEDGSIALPPELVEELQSWNVLDVRPTSGMTAANVEAARAIGLDRWIRIIVPVGTDTPAMASTLSQLGAIVEVAEAPGIGTTADIPDDTYFNLQYAMHNLGQYVNGRQGTADADIDAVQAWDWSANGNPIAVAVIDSGVDPHAEYNDRLLSGWNSVDNNSDSSDDCPHGTHVAGIVGARGNNGFGVAGVNWNAFILPVRVLTGCSGTTDQCADGIIWAVDHGADIGSMSLQYYVFNQYFEDAALYAEANNVLLIAANGNNRGRVIAWPARFESVMAVAATTNRDERASFSNYGPECEIAAPGQDVYSTWIDEGYEYGSGTSMATPMVSGLASLIWAIDPSLTASEIRTILVNSVDDLGPVGWDEEFGYGRINAMTALAAVGRGPRTFHLDVTPLVAGESATLSASQAESGRKVFFTYSLRGLGEEYVQQLGVALELERPSLAGTATADNAGNARLTARVPDAARGRTIWLQAAQSGGTSNTLEQIVQ